MFDNTERIESMTYEEYKQTVYYFNHPDEYAGDFVAFRDKVIDFVSSEKKPMIGDWGHPETNK